MDPWIHRSGFQGRQEAGWRGAGVGCPTEAPLQGSVRPLDTLCCEQWRVSEGSRPSAFRKLNLVLNKHLLNERMIQLKSKTKT